MTTKTTERQLTDTLLAAGKAHHNYESDFLAGTRDPHWSGWYAAYVLGRLGDFTTPTLLTRWLEEVSGESDWHERAAALVHSNLVGSGSH